MTVKADKVKVSGKETLGEISAIALGAHTKSKGAFADIVTEWMLSRGFPVVVDLYNKLNASADQYLHRKGKYAKLSAEQFAVAVLTDLGYEV